MENEQMILVPESWFKELLKLSENADEEIKKMADTNFHAVCLIGYVRSVKSILKYNDRQLLTTKPQGK